MSKQSVQGKNNKVAADGQLNRNGKRARRAGKEKEDDSSTKLPMQSKSKDTGDAKSKDSDILPQDYYSRGDSKSRDSWKSKQSLDGQTELLQSLVHAVHVSTSCHYFSLYQSLSETWCKFFAYLPDKICLSDIALFVDSVFSILN